MKDAEYMERAIKLAARGLGHTRPNPAVGAVIVKGGKIIGEGWHKKAGGDHAEVAAIKNALRRVISQDLGEIFSDKPSSLDLSDEAVVSIFEHYNPTDYACIALEKGTNDKQDNGVLSGITTDHSTHEMKIRVDGNRKSEVIDYYYEIINLFAHEKQHVIDYNNKVYGSESRAIKAQINDSSFSRTRKSFQDATFEYAKKLGIKL